MNAGCVVNLGWGKHHRLQLDNVRGRQVERGVVGACLSMGLEIFECVVKRLILFEVASPVEGESKHALH